MKFKLNTEDNKVQAIKELVNCPADGSFWFILRKVIRLRTPKQRRYYWLLMSILEKESGTGYSKEDFHEVFTQMFGTPNKEILGLKCIKRTSDMNTVELTERIEQIKQYSCTNDYFCVHLPNSDDNSLKEFYDKYYDEDSEKI